MVNDYDDMKAAWWTIWTPIVGELHEAFMRGQVDRFNEGLVDLRAAIDRLADEEPEPQAKPSRHCQNCVHWRGKGTRRVCRNERATMYMLTVGAGEVCGEHALLGPGQWG